jgi:hypothetical protein
MADWANEAVSYTIDGQSPDEYDKEPLRILPCANGTPELLSESPTGTALPDADISFTLQMDV